jgi:hypothetical protein
LEESIEEDDDEGCCDELNADACAEFFGRAVKTGKDADGCVVEGDDEWEDWGKELGQWEVKDTWKW